MMKERIDIHEFTRKSRYLSARIQSTLAWYEIKLGYFELIDSQKEYLKGLLLGVDYVTEMQAESQIYAWRFRN